MTQAEPTGTPQPDATQASNAIDLTLCHLAELIDMARAIASDMHDNATAPHDTVRHVSGRIGTLMHCASRELEEAKRAACILARSF